MKLLLNVYTGHYFAIPFFFSKFEDNASEIERAIEGFSATIITTAGLPTLSEKGPFA